jgi:hypothetical protein
LAHGALALTPAPAHAHAHAHAGEFSSRGHIE